MKKSIALFIALLLSTICLQAQDDNKNINVHEETITKIVTVKGITEETKITETIKREEQVIEINDIGEENQRETYSKDKKVTSSTTTQVKLNAENDDAISEIKKAQKEEIENSKNEELKKYKTNKIETEKKNDGELKSKKSIKDNQ